MAEDEAVASEAFSFVAGDAASEEGNSESTGPKWQVFVNDLAWGSKPIRQVKREKDL